MALRKSLIAGGIACLLAGAALAQYVPGVIRVTSLAVSNYSLPINTGGPQSATIAVNGGTFTCTGGGTITVANAAVDAGSTIWMTLKTVGGTVAAPFVATITPGTGFSATCGASDTSVYNYVILG